MSSVQNPLLVDDEFGDGKLPFIKNWGILRILIQELVESRSKPTRTFLFGWETRSSSKLLPMFFWGIHREYGYPNRSEALFNHWIED